MSEETGHGRIAIVGEFDPNFTPHEATNTAIAHSTEHLGLDIAAHWISAEDIHPDMLREYTGIWMAPGSPYKNLQKALSAIQYARGNGMPCFGTCGGFQHMVIEYARNVLGYKDAQHAEYDPYGSKLFISSLACSLAGREMRLRFLAGSKVAKIYGAVEATERYYCNFGVNPEVVPLFKNSPMRIAGWDDEGEIRVLELPEHQFFVATLFVPQTLSRAEHPHPLVTAFIKAVAEQAGMRGEEGEK